MTNAILELERAAGICERLLAAADRDAALLDSLGAYLGAEMAVFREFATAGAGARLIALHTRGIPERVTSAYLERFIDLDPARGLLDQSLDAPLVIHDAQRGPAFPEAPAGSRGQAYRDEFRRYRDEFLRPSRLTQHLGFCFRDAHHRNMILFDFHRPPNAAPFGPLERAQAALVASLLRARSVGAAREESGSEPVAAREVGRTAVPFHETILSRRERQVALAVARGLSNKQLAVDLECSVRTIENHLRAIYAKTGVTSRTRLAALLHGMNGTGD